MFSWLLHRISRNVATIKDAEPARNIDSVVENLSMHNKVPTRDILPLTVCSLEDELCELSSKMLAEIAIFREMHAAVIAALPVAAKGVDETRVVERKSRFTKYRDTLQTYIGRLDVVISSLEANHNSCVLLERSIRSGGLGPLILPGEVAEIHSVLQDIGNEEDIDEVWRRKVHSINREFGEILKRREIRAVEADRKRRGFGEERNQAKHERERMPRPTGQRDNWSSDN